MARMGRRKGRERKARELQPLTVVLHDWTMAETFVLLSTLPEDAPIPMLQQEDGVASVSMYAARRGAMATTAWFPALQRDRRLQLNL